MWPALVLGAGLRAAVDEPTRRGVAFSATTKDELKAIRTRLGMTQRELARRVGVVPKTVARWESGVHPIDPVYDRLIRIAAAAFEMERAAAERKE